MRWDKNPHPAWTSLPYPTQDFAAPFTADVLGPRGKIGFIFKCHLNVMQFCHKYRVINRAAITSNSVTQRLSLRKGAGTSFEGQASNDVVCHDLLHDNSSKTTPRLKMYSNACCHYSTQFWDPKTPDVNGAWEYFTLYHVHTVDCLPNTGNYH